MKNTVYRNLLGVFAAVMILSTGVLIGSYLTETRIEIEQGSLYNTTKIAVVNLDEGVTYDGEYRNFASELISSQDKDLIVTGLDDAKNGMNEGRYSAYIIMPSNFSQNTTTINTEPVKSVLKYEIGSNLSDIARDKATINVAEINNTINDDLGYVYLNSVFESFHGGQNSALKVLGNDSKDKAVIMAISNVDLIESVNLTEVERLQNDIEKLNIVEDFEKNKALIDTIDEAYKSYLGKTSEEINDIKSDSDNIMNHTIVLNDAILLTPTIESAGYQLNNTKRVLSAYSIALDTFKSDTKNLMNAENSNSQDSMGEYKNLVLEFIKQVDVFNAELANYNNYLSIKDSMADTTSSIDISKFPSLANRLDLIFKENEKTNIKRQIEDYITNGLLKQFGTAKTSEDALTALFLEATNNSDINYLVKQYADLSAMATMVSLEEYYNYTRYPGDDMELSIFDEDALKENIIADLKVDLPIVYTSITASLEANDQAFPAISVNTESITKSTNNQRNDIFDVTNILTQISSIASIADTDIEASVSSDLSQLKQQQSDAKKALVEKANSNIVLSEQFTTRLNIFHPLAFIDEKEVDGFVRDYYRYTGSIESKISNKDFEYKSFVDKSYNQANDHVDMIKQDISKYQQASDEKLANGLQIVQDTKEGTSNDNQRIMSNFINTLPYSRLGENANTGLYQFMVEPVDSEFKETAIIGTKKGDNYSTYFIISLFSATILLVGTVGYKKIKHKKITDS